MCYDLPRSRCVEQLLLHQLRFFIAKGRVCFLPSAISLSLFIVWLKPYNSIQQLDRLNKIAIGRKQTRPFAINKVSTDAIIIFLLSESAANHNTCLYGERFQLFMPVIIYGLIFTFKN